MGVFFSGLDDVLVSICSGLMWFALGIVLLFAVVLVLVSICSGLMWFALGIVLLTVCCGSCVGYHLLWFDVVCSWYSYVVCCGSCVS